MGKKLSKEERGRLKARMLVILSKHIGKSNPIRMADLYREVFGVEPRDSIQTTRIIRNFITELRREGVPVCSSMKSDNGGYYLSNSGSELDDYLKRLRGRALRALSMEAKLRKMTLPQLLGHIQLNLR